MRGVELIQKKRDAGTHTREELAFLINEFTRGALPDYQMGAWLMAVYFRGLNPAETADLTDLMLRSGEVLDFSELPGPKVDKHSTGGVGDKTSLILAPVAAAGGVLVPMISGRGLGHSGGTVDKLESIPGFRTDLALPEFRRALKEVGCALIGQTKEIAPADKKIYALRDLTATVACIPLITGSILSKKLAEGIDALVLDVKVGNGAFMKDEAQATALAESMRAIGTRMGKRMVALLTGMDQPLGRAAGNAIEVAESVDTLRGNGPADLTQLCRELSAWMLHLGARAKSLEEGRQQYDRLIASGAAAEKFRQIIAHQGGDPRVVDDPKRLPQARLRADWPAPAAGVVTSMQTERLGWATMALGAGRLRLEDAVDPAAGFLFHKKLGERVEKGEPLLTAFYNEERKWNEAKRWLEGAIEIGASALPPPPLVRKTLS
ncbi:MAG: thymidine phosphorylase [Candidatus Acidiferrales bacterium]